jgi:hypothetical protein
LAGERPGLIWVDEMIEAAQAAGRHAGLDAAAGSNGRRPRCMRKIWSALRMRNEQ